MVRAPRNCDCVGHRLNKQGTCGAKLPNAIIILIMSGRGKGGKGYGTGGAVRHRRALFGSLAGITTPSIRRLARRAGVKRMSALVPSDARGVLREFLERILHDTATYAAHARRKTVIAMDVVRALKLHGRTLYGFGMSTHYTVRRTPRRVARHGGCGLLPTWGPKGLDPSTHVVVTATTFKPRALTREEKAGVTDRLQSAAIVKIGEEEVTPEDITEHLAEEGTWLHDIIINLVIRLLQTREQEKRAAGSPYSMFFSSHMLVQLMHGYDDDDTGQEGGAATSWRPRIVAMRHQLTCGAADMWGASDASLLFVPINSGGNTHWSCIVADMATRQLYYVNSLVGCTPTNLHQMLQAVKGFLDALELGCGWTPAQPWTTVPDTRKLPPFAYSPGAQQPQQTNGSDCGVFTLLHMDSMSLHVRGNGYAVTQDIILSRQARWRMALALVSNENKVCLVSAKSTRHPKGRLCRKATEVAESAQAAQSVSASASSSA